MRFDWPDAAKLTGWLWVFLGAALLMPFPAYGWILPERGIPIMWLMLGGLACLAARVATTSWPLAAILMWSAARAGYHGFPLRSLQVLALLCMAALLYVAARNLEDRIVRYAAWAWLAGLTWQGVLGAFNATGVYPWMGWVQPEQIGKPMGLLTHPNYWGSIMAMGLPLIWSLLGIPAAILAGALILKTISAGPVISAAVAALVMAWPMFSRRVRLLVAGLGATAIGVTMTLHEWRLSGRREVWQAAWPEIMKWPVMGQGLGQWRVWAEDYNAAHKQVFATLQAHNEALQLWFELGLIGVALGALLLWQAGRAGWRVWQAAPAARLEGPWYQWGRAPLERAWLGVLAAAFVNSFGSPTFHLPAQGALAFFALARIQADAEAFHRGEAPRFRPSLTRVAANDNHPKKETVHAEAGNS